MSIYDDAITAVDKFYDHWKVNTVGKKECGTVASELFTNEL